MLNEWQQVSSKEVHKNPWYRVMQDDVLMPSGQMGKYTYIDRLPGVIILALTPQNEIYLVGQYRYPVKKFSWELPMGTIETAEQNDFLAAAKRELLEEVGLVADDWQEVGKIFYASGVSDQEGHVFLARQLQEKEAMPDYTEFLTMKKVPWVEFEKQIASGEITDSPSISAFYKVKLFLKG